MTTRTNIFGEQVDVLPLYLEWMEPCHLWVYRGQKKGKDFLCNVSPNGWTGKCASIQYELGEPVIQNLNHARELSFKELEQIIKEFWTHITPGQCVDIVNKTIAAEKLRP